MQRPELEDWRRTYQETIQDTLEMWSHSPRYRVLPDGAGGQSCAVADLDRDDLYRCAMREAEIIMNRLANTRKQ